MSLLKSKNQKILRQEQEQEQGAENALSGASLLVRRIDNDVITTTEKNDMSQPHVHGPNCRHDHHHEHDPHDHVHGPNCNHGVKTPVRNAMKDVGRNDPCPCGSGRKFKKCHGG